MFSSLVVLAILIIIGRWIVRSVMDPGLGGGGKVDQRAAQWRARMEEARAKLGEAKPVRTPAPTPASTASRNDKARRPQPAGNQLPRAQETVWPWHVELDVPQDAPRTEVIAAVKRRLASARASGDNSGIGRITRAAAAGLGRWPPGGKSKGPRAEI